MCMNSSSIFTNKDKFGLDYICIASVKDTYFSTD